MNRVDLMFLKKSFDSSPIEYIIVGLGNPGKQYENTRHNAGFICIDAISESLGVKVNKIKFKGLCGECKINGHRVLLLKPSTFMNNSGQSVVEAMNFYKLPPENVIIIFDDISLDVGRMRIRRKGSDGGQRGMKSIIYLSGSDAFPRIKVGIGNKPHPDYDLAAWVLSRFSSKEMTLLEGVIKDVQSAVSYMVDGNIDTAMGKFNS